MFETSAVESRRKSRSTGATYLLPVSITLHLAAISAAAFAAVWDISFPLAPPGQVEMLPTARIPVVPPAGPKPKGETPQPAKAASPPKIVQNAAPSEIPDEIPQQVEPETPSNAVDGSVGDGGSGNYAEVIGGGGNPDSVGPGVPEPALAPVHVGGAVKAPVIIRRIDPVYPPLMQKIRKDGRAVVQCVIDRNGTIQHIEVIDATNELFSAAAVDAVRQWRFRPGTREGKPLDVIYHLTVTFNVQ